MKVNTEQSHLLLSGNTQLTSNIDNNLITSEKEQILSTTIIDWNLSFEEHINNLCKKESQKINTLARIACYMGIQKRRTIMKSFITSQFGYCLLVWMFHSRSLNNRINSIYERALRITYDDKTSTFQQLLEKDNSVSIHHRNLQTLATKMFKISNNLSPGIVKEMFQERFAHCNLRRNNSFTRRQVNSVYHSTESLSFLGTKMWDLVPLEIKKSENVNILKSRIKKWTPLHCPCR